eukprot:maker-scaffold517_size150149-snap-gene-0.15 protein:Tk02934 transcript:maker-scaffold517_size150149-snap-gene-0.15-mRNA-1 annotation:"beta-carbonic anhydrase"
MPIPIESPSQVPSREKGKEKLGDSFGLPEIKPYTMATGAGYKVGIEKLFRGILKYRNTFKGNMVKQFKEVRDNPRPTAVFFTCVDSRMLPTRFTQTNVGDMFIVRNVGNMVPHAQNVDTSSTATEPATLELGCKINGIKHVVVCGHSDCKAMNVLYTLHKSASWSHDKLSESPIKAWLNRHGTKSLKHYERIERSSFRRPLLLHAENPVSEFAAYIDVDNKFSATDKLSQVNTLLQMENIASYGFMGDLVRDGRTHIHAMWFDIYTGDIYYFSRKQKCFVTIEDSNVEELLSEVDSGGSNTTPTSSSSAILGESQLASIPAR